MDFKIAGTKRGYTALQADVKIPGVPLKIIMESIGHATGAKNRIINIMNSVISLPRHDKKHNKPVLETIEIPIHKRAKFLGTGGSNLKKIFIETGVNVRLKSTYVNSNRFDLFIKQRIICVDNNFFFICRYIRKTTTCIPYSRLIKMQ